MNKLDKLIYDTMIAKCNNCTSYAECTQDLIGMKPVIVNGKIRSVECGKRFGHIQGKYAEQVLSAPPIYESKRDLFNKLVKKENGYVRSPAGFGKTTLMLNIAKHFYRDGYNVMYELAVNISTELKDFTNENESIADKIKKYQDVDILFIDDFARESLTAYKIMDIFNPIIQYRIDNNKPLYINSNYTLDQLFKVIESKVDTVSADAFCDRIKHNLGLFKLDGKNYRR